MASRKHQQRGSKPKRINMNVKEKWEQILSDIEMPEVPVDVLERMVVRLIDGSKVNIDIFELLTIYKDSQIIEEYLNNKLSELDHLIEDVDYFVNIEMVAKVVQPETDKLLSRL